MIDPLLSLALNLDSGKGHYALLLGSGISTASGIPTGWDVVKDICRKLQQKEGVSNDSLGPEDWYEQRFGVKPDYSGLLEKVCDTPEERQVLLRSYFEREADDDDPQNRMPSVAHRSIARMVKEGYFRVIITTNFDRLMEQALRDEGVEPQVVATPDAVDGMLPVVHSNRLLFKVNGDCLDVRIKNLSGELNEYDRKTARLLRRILEDFGLVVCGWSADWDIALRQCLYRRHNRRFSTYWVVRSKLTDEAKCITDHLKAQVIFGMDADQVFTALEEKTLGLRDSKPAHPLSAKIAVATLKRHLETPSGKIRVDTLVRNETELAVKRIDEAKLRDSREGLEFKVDAYEQHLSVLLPMIVTGCYYGEVEHVLVWSNVLGRLASNVYVHGTTMYPDLSAYPLTLGLYCGGLACVVARKYLVLGRILRESKITRLDGSRTFAALEVGGWDDFQRYVFEAGKYRWAGNMLYERCRRWLSEIISDEQEYEATFLEFECLLAMFYFDNMPPFTGGQEQEVLNTRLPDSHMAATVTRIRNVVQGTRFFDQYEKTMSNKWPPLSAEIVQGDLDRARRVVQFLRRGMLPIGS